MLQSTDGFFSMVTPRMDAVEEITVTGAVPGAGAGAGSVQVAMTTRSGSNKMEGSVYHYWRDPQFNSNYFFNKVNNLPKNNVVVHQYGFRQGGPIVIPGLYDGHNKAFFFFNYERLYQPSSVTRTRNLLRPEAQAESSATTSPSPGPAAPDDQPDRPGAAERQITALDPTDAEAADRHPPVHDDDRDGQRYRQRPTAQLRLPERGGRQPVFSDGKVDFNLSDRHRLSGSYWWQRFTSNPDLLNTASIPCGRAAQRRDAELVPDHGSSTLRSTLGQAKVNELVRRLAVVAQ
jgi:hypothetical protein